MKLKTLRFAPLAAVLLAAVFLHGCGYRAEAAPLASNAPAAAEECACLTGEELTRAELDGRLAGLEVLSAFRVLD